MVILYIILVISPRLRPEGMGLSCAPKEEARQEQEETESFLQ